MPKRNSKLTEELQNKTYLFKKKVVKLIGTHAQAVCLMCHFLRAGVIRLTTAASSCRPWIRVVVDSVIIFKSADAVDEDLPS